ncbi:hypothetical protein BN133_2601 [Cronobacter dublinensis 582]|nr:hypothetical protein BN133_2601 [Cronobacter dublinensis 582]
MMRLNEGYTLLLRKSAWSMTPPPPLKPSRANWCAASNC